MNAAITNIESVQCLNSLHHISPQRKLIVSKRTQGFDIISTHQRLRNTHQKRMQRLCKSVKARMCKKERERERERESRLTAFKSATTFEVYVESRNIHKSFFF